LISGGGWCVSCRFPWFDSAGPRFGFRAALQQQLYLVKGYQMKKATFNIRIAAGRVIPVSGYLLYTFAGSRVACYRQGGLWYAVDLASGCFLVAVNRIKDILPALFDLYKLDHFDSVKYGRDAFPETNPGVDPRFVILSTTW
jgi:hypothetical protein